MTVFYNEIDEYAAAWLKNLIYDGQIPQGIVDTRDIRCIDPSYLQQFIQCHFFAGIGGWSYALQMAGWQNDAAVWTGSCPCQPFSVAGKGKGKSDERHLWPAWSALIRSCKPAIVFGEQVASAIRFGWWDDVSSDLASIGYETGAAILPACAAGAPHRRDRLWFVGYTKHDGQLAMSQPRSKKTSVQYIKEGADSTSQLKGASDPSNVANTTSVHVERCAYRSRKIEHWGDCEWIVCPDGKSRPYKPSIRMLDNGVQSRAPKLRAYGNAIVPQVAGIFIESCMEAIAEQ